MADGDYTVRVEGLEEALADLVKDGSPSQVHAAIREALLFLWRRIAIYPPLPPPPRMADREGNLGKRWKTSTKYNGGNPSGEVSNNAGYATYVQGPAQRHYHRATGWKTVDDVAEQYADDVVNMIKAKAWEAGFN